MDQTFDSIWPGLALGAASAEARGEFYDDIAEDDTEHQFLSPSDSEVWESQEFRVGLVRPDGSIISAVGLSDEACKAGGFSLLQGTPANVYLDRYFTYRMPASNFKLQLLLGARHAFGNSGPTDVGHCLVVDGSSGSHVNMTGESCFRGLQVKDDLGLDICVNFLVDKDTASLVKVLESAPLKEGIQLTAVYNPVFPIALSYLLMATEALLKARKNKPIVKYRLSLRSNAGEAGIPLIAGTFVILQDWATGSASFSWDRYAWSKEGGQLKYKGEPVRANYMLLRLEQGRA